MLYRPGSHLGGPSPAAAATAICADTDVILDRWEETFTVHRRPAAPSYDSSGKVVDVWIAVGIFDGDWQPASGATQRAESGLNIRSDAIIIAPCNTDVQPDDKIYRVDGSFQYVNYIRDYEDHMTIYLTKTAGAN